MRKIILCLIALGLTCSPAKTQDIELPVADMSKLFFELYQQSGKVPTMFDRLINATDLFLRPENTIFTESVNRVIRQKHITVDSAARIVFNAMFSDFNGKGLLWEDYASPGLQYSKLLEYYNSQICPCLENGLKKSGRLILGPEVLSNCMTSLLRDTAYINTVRRIAGTIAVTELDQLSRSSIIYMYYHCESMKKMFDFISQEGALLNYAEAFYLPRAGLDTAITDNYRLKNFSRLNNIFPAYKNFMPAILKLIEIQRKVPETLMQENKDDAANLSFSKVYYEINQKGKAVLLGAFFFRLKEPTFQAPVTELRFITPDKIKNRAEVLRIIQERLEIVEPPPPPPMDQLPPGIIISPAGPKKNN